MKPPEWISMTDEYLNQFLRLNDFIVNINISRHSWWHVQAPCLNEYLIIHIDLAIGVSVVVDAIFLTDTSPKYLGDTCIWVRIISHLKTMMCFSSFLCLSSFWFVNNNIGNHTTHFKSCVDDIKNLCHCRQVWTGPEFPKYWLLKLHSQTDKNISFVCPTTFPKFWGKNAKATTKVNLYEPQMKFNKMQELLDIYWNAKLMS